MSVLMFLLMHDGIEYSVMALVLSSQVGNGCVACSGDGLQQTRTLLHDGSHLTQHLRFCRRVDGSNLAVYGRELL